MLKRILNRFAEELRIIYKVIALPLPTRILELLADEALRFRHRLNDVVRHRKANGNSEIESQVEAQVKGVEPLKREVLNRKSSWSHMEIPECPVPSMLTKDEMRYYHYISQFYSGAGAVVEIGPWIGSSTYNIVAGLLANPAFTKDKRLYVYDDFVWRSSWMDKWIVGKDIKLLDNGSSFQPLFHEMTDDFSTYIETKAMKLMDTGDNRDVPWFAWEHGPVELCFIDCGRALKMNETWYQALEPYFIPDRTIIIMQDWQNFKNVPESFWENTKIFTDSKLQHLDLVHELANSGTAAFIYRG
ncbi:MAG: hypothetical protein R8K49_08760 [Mariprofundaceae bacterium]